MYILFFLCSFLDLVKLNNKKIIYIFLTTVLILIAGLRYNSGYDYNSYIQIIKYADSITGLFKTRIEPGFMLFNYFLNTIISNPYFNIFVIAFISIIIKVVFIKKNSYYIFIPLFYYYNFSFLTLEMGQIRNGLAVAILLISFKYISEQNFYKFTFFVILATSVHYSSIIFLPAYFIEKWTINRKQIIILTILSIFIGFINLKNVFIIILEFLPNINFVNVALQHLYFTEYVERIGVGGLQIWRFGLLLFCFMFYYSKIQINKDIDRIFKLFFVGIIISFALNSISIFSIRLSRPFLFFEGLVFAHIIFSFKEEQPKFLALLFTNFIFFYKFKQYFQDTRWEEYKDIFNLFY
jgi:hypothetical protein